MTRSVSMMPWSALRRIGQSRIVSLTILIPLIGYVILFNEELAHLFELSPLLVPPAPSETGLDRSLMETKARLYYFYFGLTFLGIASVFYQLFCPTLVKDYGSSIKFVSEQQALTSEARLQSLISQLAKTDLGERTTAQLMHLDAEIRGDPAAALAQRPSGPPLDRTDVMHLFWQLHDGSTPILRVIIATCYTLGFSILALPSLDIFARVVRAFFRLA